MMRSKSKLPFPGKPKIAVVVDGQTEYWYLKMIQRNEISSNVDIKPEIPQRKTLVELYEKAKMLSNIYDKVIWIIDLDVILRESKLTEFINYKNELEIKFDNILTIINQPCLEYWLLLHYRFTSPLLANCSEAEQLLSKYFRDYSKTERLYVKQGHDIYLRLRGNLSFAICNSKKLGVFDSDSPYRGFTEMYKLFKELGIK